MASVIYTLCALTALTCAILLLRGYFANKAPLLLWSGLCFLGLTLNNVLVVVDLVIFPTSVDLRMARALAGLGSMVLLLYGLIFQREASP